MPVNSEYHTCLGFYQPEGCGGIFWGEDDAVMMSVPLYEEFVVPYNTRLCEAFGGGGLHFCGKANHLLNSIAKIKGLKCIQNNLVGDFPHFPEMRKLLRENGITLILGEQTPVDPVAYYKELATYLEGDDRVGLILGTWYKPTLGLVDLNVGPHKITDRAEMMKVLENTFMKL
ncbi:MAG: uroporphyrinogen decarboxylase family protein [Clostridiales bacterium]|nr:uroporphyrinogen decarboxylase family protein [Clostridiales bacterium]